MRSNYVPLYREYLHAICNKTCRDLLRTVRPSTVLRTKLLVTLTSRFRNQRRVPK